MNAGSSKGWCTCATAPERKITTPVQVACLVVWGGKPRHCYCALPPNLAPAQW
jgi:hypothetical protein